MDNDKLFFSIWRNNYLRKLIFNQLSLFEMYRFKVDITKIEDLKKKEAQYYKSIKIILGSSGSYSSGREEIIELLECIPDNIKIIEFNTYKFEDTLNLIGSIPSTITTIKINNKQIGGSYGKKSDTISSSLKKLFLGNENENVIESLPNYQKLTMLTHLDIGSYNGSFKNGSLPITLTSFKCNSIGINSFNLDSLPIKNIINLNFNGSTCSKFKSNDINSNGNGNGFKNDFSKLVNLKYLNLGQGFKSKIQIGQLPNGLKTLVLPYCFNTENNIKQYSIPSSVTKLSFHKFKYDHPSPLMYQTTKLFKISLSILPCSLITLKLGKNHYFEETINEKNKIESFNKMSIASDTFFISQIPKSVTKLKIRGHNTSLSIPNNIKSLSLIGHFKFENPIELINLTSLRISDNNFTNSNYFNNLMPLKSYSINFELDNKIELCNTLNSLSINELYLNNQIFPKSLSILEFSITYPLDTNQLPSSINTLIICGAPEILLPLSTNIKLVYIHFKNCQQLLSKLNLFENNHLLDTFKLVDFETGIFKKLSNKL